MKLILQKNAYGKPPLLFAVQCRLGDTKVIAFQPNRRLFKKTFSLVDDKIYSFAIKQKAREELAGYPDGYYLPKTLAGAVGVPWIGDIIYLTEHTFNEWSRKCVVA